MQNGQTYLWKGFRPMNERLRKGTTLKEELALLCESLTPKRYTKGEIVYQAGDLDDSVYFVKTGKVKLAYLDESGRKLTLNILGEGEILGEMALVGEKRRELIAQALQESRIYSINSARFLNFLEERPWLMLELIALFGSRTREIEHKLEDLVFKDIPTRLSRQLLRLIHEHGEETAEGTEIDFKITHKELADLIGSARENTTSALNRLAREGILDKHRYRIIVKDAERLKEKSSP